MIFKTINNRNLNCTDSKSVPAGHFALMKDFIILIFIIIPNFAFGQASGSGNFMINVKFEKEIPVEELEVYYYETSHNRIDKVNFKLNTIENTIEIFGHNDFVVGAGFPIIVFSHKGKKIYTKTHFAEDNEETETLNLFYLIIKQDSFNGGDFDKELKFSYEKPNIIVRFENINGIIKYKVSKEPTYFLPVYEMSISNKLIKINPQIK